MVSGECRVSGACRVSDACRVREEADTVVINEIKGGKKKRRKCTI